MRWACARWPAADPRRQAGHAVANLSLQSAAGHADAAQRRFDRGPLPPGRHRCGRPDQLPGADRPARPSFPLPHSRLAAADASPSACPRGPAAGGARRRRVGSIACRPRQDGGHEVEYDAARCPVAAACITSKLLYAALGQPLRPLAAADRRPFPTCRSSRSPWNAPGCLPPGVTPLREDGLRQGPVMSSRGPGCLPRLPTPKRADWQAQQEQAVTEAILAMRKEHRRGRELVAGRSAGTDRHRSSEGSGHSDYRHRSAGGAGGVSIQQCASGSLGGKGEPPWSPRSFPLPVPWESVGLTYQPCRPAPLLTSRTQQLLWEEERRPDRAGGGGSRARMVRIARAASAV